MFNKNKAKFITLFLLTLFVSKSFAVVTYLNCPTLKPLPVTAFMPAAMLPIKTTEKAYDAGMLLISNTINKITIDQINATSSTYNSIIKNFIKISNDQQQQMIEMDRNFQDMKLAQKSDLEKELKRSSAMIYPSDPAMRRLPDGSEPTVDPSSPTYTYVKKLCSSAKMAVMSSSVTVDEKAKEEIQRRNRKINLSIAAVSDVNIAAKNNIDYHYDLFCSQQEYNNGVCESVSETPNIDISAYNFLYPIGFKEDNQLSHANGFSTLYTYSPVESLASYQYIKNLTGNLFIEPPTLNELNDVRKARFVGAYKQRLAILSLSSDVMLDISERRQPINASGVVMSQLDVLNYQIEKSTSIESTRSYKSMGDSGKLLEIQKQLAISNQLKNIILKQKDKERQLEAASLSLKTVKNTTR